MPEDEKFSLRSSNFILFSLTNFLFYGSFYLYLPLIPMYIQSLGGSPLDIGIAGGSFGATSVIFRPYLGKLADRHGRKSLLLIGTACFSVFFLMLAMFKSIPAFIGIRIFHGFFLGMYFAASAAYIADYAPAARRGEVLGIYQTMRVISMAIFPVIGIWVIKQTASFTTLFLITFAVSVACFLSALPIKDIAATKSTKTDIPLWPIFKQRVVFICSLTLLGASTIYGSIITFLPAFAVVRGVEDFSSFYIVYAVATMLCRVITGKWSDIVGRRKVIIPFSVFIALSSFAFIILRDQWTLALIGILFGLGYGALVPALTAFVIDKTQPEERGPALGFFTSFIETGIVVGSVLFGVIAELFGYVSIFIFGGTSMLIILIIFIATIKESDVIIIKSEEKTL